VERRKLTVAGEEPQEKRKEGGEGERGRGTPEEEKGGNAVGYRKHRGKSWFKFKKRNHPGTKNHRVLKRIADSREQRRQGHSKAGDSTYKRSTKDKGVHRKREEPLPSENAEVKGKKSNQETEQVSREVSSAHVATKKKKKIRKKQEGDMAELENYFRGRGVRKKNKMGVKRGHDEKT